jgi:hypothetical protein
LWQTWEDGKIKALISGLDRKTLIRGLQGPTLKTFQAVIVVSNPQMKQHCYFNQFIAISDNLHQIFRVFMGNQNGGV